MNCVQLNLVFVVGLACGGAPRSLAVPALCSAERTKYLDN